MDRQDAPAVRLGKAARRGEGEELALETDPGRVPAPEQPEHVDRFVSSPAPGPEANADRGGLARQHAQADRQEAHPAAG